MNSKTQRTTVWGDDKPPVYNMAIDAPSIDSTYNRVEDINAPFINNYLQPHYEKKHDEKIIVDKQGHKYVVRGNSLLKDDESLGFSITPKKFARKEVSYSNDVLDFDINDTDEAILRWNTATNSATFDYLGKTLSSGNLFVEGLIISSKVKICSDKTAIAVIVYKRDTTLYHNYMRIKSDGSAWQFSNRVMNWYRMRNRTAGSGAVSIYNVNSATQYGNVGISIARVFNNTYGVSFISNAGEIRDTEHIAFRTFFEANDVVFNMNGTNLMPNLNTIPQQVTTTYVATLSRTISRSSNRRQYTCISPDDGITFYKYEEQGVVGERIDFGTYSPISTGNIVVIDEKTYRVYNYVEFANSAVVRIYHSAPQGFDWYFKANEVQSANDQNQTKEVTLTTTTYGTSNDFDIDLRVYWNDKEFIMNTSNDYLTASITVTSTTSTGWLTYPNIVLDNGNMYSMYSLNRAALTTGNRVVESGVVSAVSINGSVLTYTITAIESFTVSSASYKMRSNTFGFINGFVQSTTKATNQSQDLTIYPPYYQSTVGNISAGSDDGNTTTWTNSNGSDLHFLPGNALLAELQFGTDYSITDNAGPFVIHGDRVNLNDHWHLLTNVDSAAHVAMLGLSYSEATDDIGTLVSDWTDINPNVTPKVATNRIIYKDYANKYIEISIQDGYELSTDAEDRFIFINTTSYYNCYDTKLGKKYHYASDYNNRLLFGTHNWHDGFAWSKRTDYNVPTSTGINKGFRNRREYIVSSLFPAVTRIDCLYSSYDCSGAEVPESRDAQGIDVYYGVPSVAGATKTARVAYYKETYFRERGVDYKYADVDLIGTSATSEAYYTPSIFMSYLVGSAERSFVTNGHYSYPLIYYNGNLVPAYTINGMIEDADAFFVLQGQYYAVINDKIYALIYSNNAIQEQDAIIDIRGLHYLGNTPSIAFFWSESMRGFYSFTGDANLTHIFPGSKFKEIDYVNHYYEQSSQAIWIATDIGILVISPRNIYRLPEYTNVTNIQFDDNGKVWITDNNKTTKLSYYPDSDMTSKHVKLETSFFGIGAEEVTSIDRWDIIVYNPFDMELHDSIKLKASSLTDIATVTEEAKEVQIHQFDPLSKSVKVSFSPKLIKGKGLKLTIDSPWPIQQITPHLADNGYSQTTNRRFEA